MKTAISATKEKLDALKTAQQQAKQQMESGDLGKDKYDALQREIIATEEELKRLAKEAAEANTALNKIGSAGKTLENVGNKMSSVGSSLTRNVTMPIVAIGTAAVKTTADFDAQMSKVSAISNMIHKYTSTQNVFAIQEPFTSNTEAGDIMMCGFDSMAARELFFASWYNHVLSKPAEERKNCLYIDGRLSIDTLQIFCITGEDDEYMTQYNLKYLFSDSEADDTICSMKQTTYLACMIGSLMTNLFTNWVANSLNPIIPYDLPFFVEYDAQNMIFKTVS